MKVEFRVEKRMSPIFWAGVVLQFNVVYMYSRSCVCTDRKKKSVENMVLQLRLFGFRVCHFFLCLHSLLQWKVVKEKKIEFVFFISSAPWLFLSAGSQTLAHFSSIFEKKVYYYHPPCIVIALPASVHCPQCQQP
jgi:hypothetical protein